MLLQDSAGTISTLSFEHDIYTKIKKLNDNVLVGMSGSPSLGNEVVELLRELPFETAREARAAAEHAYHSVREEKLNQEFLRPNGFKNIREVTTPAPGAPIDPTVRERIFQVLGPKGREEFSLDLVLALNYGRPQLYSVAFPGVGLLDDGPKECAVRGSGSILAIDKMGEELESYKWQPELSLDEGLEVLMRAGKASEKHQGVAAPFDIRYISKKGKGVKYVRLDPLKLNMVMYVAPLIGKENGKGMGQYVARMKDDKVKPATLAKQLKKDLDVGAEFDRYFEL